MAKDKGELAVSEKAGALAVPEQLVGGLDIAGDDGPALRLSELKLFQASAREQKEYGMLPAGTFIDVLEKKALGMEVSIAVLGGIKCWVKFKQGQKFPVYTVYSKDDVPPEDLIPDPETNRTAAREQVQATVIMRGCPFPLMFRFKSTGLSCLSRTVQPLEARRKMSGKPIGMYKLGSVDDKGPGGEDFRRLTATADGDLPPDMYELASTVKASWATIVEEMKSRVEGGDDADHGNPPI